VRMQHHDWETAGAGWGGCTGCIVAAGNAVLYVVVN